MGMSHIVHCPVLTPHCRCISRGRPFPVLLLVPLHPLLAASLLLPPALMFLLLADVLPAVAAGIYLDNTVYACLQRCQHCLLCSLQMVSCRSADARR